MKVYGMNYWRHPYTRVICCCRSKREFASLVGDSLYHVRRFACETYNDEEIAFATKHPNKIILKKDDGTMKVKE